MQELDVCSEDARSTQFIVCLYFEAEALATAPKAQAYMGSIGQRGTMKPECLIVFEAKYSYTMKFGSIASSEHATQS